MINMARLLGRQIEKKQPGLEVEWEGPFEIVGYYLSADMGPSLVVMDPKGILSTVTCSMVRVLDDDFTEEI